MAKRPKPKPAPDDIAILHGRTEDGEGTRVLRIKGDGVYAGELRPAREGQPLSSGELVRLRPLCEGEPICEVEVLHASATPETPCERRDVSGPARVASESYRRNWQAVFGGSGREAPARAGQKKRRGAGQWSVN